MHSILLCTKVVYSARLSITQDMSARPLFFQLRNVVARKEAAHFACCIQNFYAAHLADGNPSVGRSNNNSYAGTAKLLLMLVTVSFLLKYFL